MSDRSTAAAPVVAIDAGAATAGAAEHVLHDLEAAYGAVGLASTHPVGGRVVLVVRWPGTSPPTAAEIAAGLGPDIAVVVDDGPVADAAGGGEAVERARQAIATHRDRTSGRLVRYAGRVMVERETTVAEVLVGSAIDEVRALAGTDLVDASVLDLTEWARPTWQQGRVVLTVQRTARGLVPFESRVQHACCHDHAVDSPSTTEVSAPVT